MNKESWSLPFGVEDLEAMWDDDDSPVIKELPNGKKRKYDRQISIAGCYEQRLVIHVFNFKTEKYKSSCIRFGGIKNCLRFKKLIYGADFDNIGLFRKWIKFDQLSKTKRIY